MKFTDSEGVEYLTKSEMDLGVRKKVDKILQTLASKRAQLVGKLNTKSEKFQLMKWEVKAAAQVRKLDELFYQQCWNYDGSFDKHLQ